ncbi:hypothetical protein B0F88_101286 [Methylobacter tundripaludum]|uniref:Uncharacterized protein n=1 Tax=Methylobacter tundripaludum TaxID=173365 RepID=A0A2S6H8F8_9GAMM|nr:hypothetical protein [Methylobacter tundripaludum]PPK73755.1 hypothetical protein B0F88_101286 [Methylobacter tundripaludum]
MTKKTQGVDELVSKVLEAISQPYGEDLIEDVFLAIERQLSWQRRYDELVLELGKNTVNQWVGQYTKQITGLKNPKQVPAKRSKLTKSYSKLYL